MDGNGDYLTNSNDYTDDYIWLFEDKKRVFHMEEFQQYHCW